MKDYIVDASVVTKWFLSESDSDRSRLLIDADCHLRAPDLLAPEFASVMLKRVIRQELTMDECMELLDRFLDEYLDVRVRIIPSRLLAQNALRIATRENRSVYDSLYIALAVQSRCQLITADERLVNAIRDKHLRQHVITLSDPALRILRPPGLFRLIDG